MHTAELYLLPPLNPESAPREPVTHLLEALDYLAKTPCKAANDADERRTLLYYDAVTHLCATFPEDRRQRVWAHHTARLMTADASPETATADREKRAAKQSLEALLTGWTGALLSATDTHPNTRHKAREAVTAARRAMAQGKTPHVALLEHVAPALRTTADDQEGSA